MMMNPMPAPGDEIWGNDVNADYKFVPRKVVFHYKDRGLFWTTNVGEVGGVPMGWYSDSFFWTENESQQECDLLNREANGEEVRCSLLAHDIGEILKASETHGPVRILPV